MMNEDEKLKFTSKSEIAECIKALTPFTCDHNGILRENFAVEKIKELTKLL